MMRDDELRGVLSLLDDQVSAPPDLVERVWVDVESLLRDEPAPARVTRLDDGSLQDDRSVSTRTWLAVAAAVLVIALGSVAVVRSPVIDRGTADDSTDSIPAVTGPPTSPGSSTAPPTAAVLEPTTLTGVCASFREAVDGIDPLDLPEARGLPQTADIQVWVDELGVLLDRLGRLDEAVEPSQLIALQLVRTSLRSALTNIRDGDTTTARIALGNAVRRLDDSPPGCLPGSDG